MSHFPENQKADIDAGAVKQTKAEVEWPKAEVEWLCVAVVGGAYGVKGDVRLKSFTAKPRGLFDLSGVQLVAKGHSIQRGEGRPVQLSFTRSVKDGLVAGLDLVHTKEEADSLKGAQLFVGRASLIDLSEDEFYLADLIGLDVRAVESGQSGDSDIIGRVKAVENFGSDDLLELVLDTPVKGFGRHIYVPFTKRLVPVVKPAGGWLSVDLAVWQSDQVGGDSVETGEALADIPAGMDGAGTGGMNDT